MMTEAERRDRRFWDRVSPEPNTGCWLWTGVVVPNGYSKFYESAETRMVSAHRWAYQRFVGPIPKGLELDHLCRTRCCVNPAHLEPVTRQENVLRGISPAAQQAKRTHCPHGHAYLGVNLLVYRGKRQCKICRELRRGRIEKAMRLMRQLTQELADV